MIKAFGYNIQPEERETVIIPMAKYATNEPVEILDLRSVKPKVGIDDIIFVYGERSARLIKDFKCRAKVEFPELYKLEKRFGEEEARRLAFDQLSKFKKALLTNTLNVTTTDRPKFTEETLPSLSSQDILVKLETILRQKGINEWIGTTVNGRTIRITVDNDPKPMADINITFAELFAMKLAMEALQIKELEIVYKHNDYKKDSSKRDIT